MSQIITPRKTDAGWVLEIPPDMASALGVASGSVALLYARDGVLETEILPPPSAAVKTEFDRLINKYDNTLEELKRIGD